MKKILSYSLSLILSLTIVLLSYSGVVGEAANSAKNTQTRTITVSAAASLRTILDEVQRNFEKQNRDIKLQFNFGGSGTLEKQIEAGAPVDVFLSADKRYLDKLETKKIIMKDSFQDIATNKLVLIVYKPNAYKIKNINDLLKSNVEKLALGTPESVPAGDYTKETLIYNKLWDKLTEKMVYAKDVSQVLNFVRLGNVDAGFVYYTDAKGKDNISIKQIIPEKAHTAIVYGGAIINTTQYKEDCQKFMKYLSGKQAQIIFGKYGFGNIVKTNTKK